MKPEQDPVPVATPPGAVWVGPARTLTQRDFDRFAALSRDDNPIHCDAEFARTSHFGATVAHGMFLYSLICAALSRRALARPDAAAHGILSRAQTLMFPAPTHAGDTVEVVVTARSEQDFDVAVRAAGAAGKAVTTAAGQTLLAGQAYADPHADPHANPAVDVGLTRADLDSDYELYGLTLGQSASQSRVFSAADLAEYTDLSGDPNPLFIDPHMARRQGLRDRPVPPPLLAGMFSDLLGTRLPGRGTGWMKQSLVFVSQAYPDESLTASVTITRLRRDKELVNLASLISTGDGRTVVTGEALVLVRNLERKTLAVAPAAP